VVCHRVADDFFVETVDDRGEVEPAFPGGDVGDVAEEFGSGSCRGEVPLDEVGDARLVSVSDGGGTVGSGLHGDQVQLAHELAD